MLTITRKCDMSWFISEMAEAVVRVTARDDARAVCSPVLRG